MNNIVYNEDCMVGMARYPDKHFDLAIVDPPYGIDVANMPYLNAKTTVKQKNGKRLGTGKKGYAKGDWDKETPPQAYFEELKRVSHDQIIFGIDYMQWEGVGKGRIKWDKGFATGVSFGQHETAYCSMINTIEILPLLWAGMQQAKSLSEPMTAQGNKNLNEKRIHPCHKPILLYQALVSRFTHSGASILDTHLGGGSSRIAAHKMGRDFVGFEVNPKYFAAQEKRFNDYSRQEVLL